MREEGIVVSSSGPTATVRFVKGEHCDSCRVCEAFGEGSAELVARNDVGARAGDRVLVEIPARDVVSGSFLIFIVPAIMMILGYFAGSRWLGSSDGAGISGAFAFLGLSLILLRAGNRYFASRNNCLARIVDTLAESAGGGETAPPA